MEAVFAEPVALNLAAPTDIIGEHTVLVEHPASAGDVVGQDEPQLTAKLRRRKKAAPAAKPVQRRASRR